MTFIFISSIVGNCSDVETPVFLHVYPTVSTLLCDDPHIITTGESSSRMSIASHSTRNRYRSVVAARSPPLLGNGAVPFVTYYLFSRYKKEDMVLKVCSS